MSDIGKKKFRNFECCRGKISKLGLLFGLILLISTNAFSVGPEGISVHIIQPGPKEKAISPVDISGNISEGRLEDGQYLWLLTSPVSDPKRWRPQQEVAPDADGNWTARANLGNDNEFNIAIFLVNEDDHERYQNAINEGDIVESPKDGKKMDSIIVKRQEVIITSPNDSDRVPSSIAVKGNIAKDFPKDGTFLWLFVNPITLNGQNWPQGGRAIEPLDEMWSTEARIGGGERDTGHEFLLLIISVNSEDNQLINNWVKETNERQDWPSISLPVSAEIEDFITVIRK